MDKEKLYYILVYVSVIITAISAVAILMTGGKINAVFAVVPCGCAFLFNNLLRVERSKKDKDNNNEQNSTKK